MAGPIAIEGLDDRLLLDLGAALGLLIETGGQAQLNPAWFKDPLDALRGIRGRQDKLFAVLEDLGGTPRSIQGMKWYAAGHNLFVVRQGAVVGLGFAYDKAMGDGTQLTAYACLPLIDLQSGDFLGAGADLPLRMGAALSGSFSGQGCSFSGVTADLQIFLAAKAPELVLQLTDLSLPDGLHLPGGASPSLADLATSAWNHPADWVAFGLDVLERRLTDPSDRELLRSLRTIAARPTDLRPWLQAWSALLQQTLAGTGTADYPFRIALAGSREAWQVDLTVTSDRGVGLAVASPVQALGSGVGWRLDLRTVFVPQPQVDVKVALVGKSGRLFSYWDMATAGSQVALDAIEFALTWTPGDAAPIPSLRFVGLALGDGAAADYGLDDIRQDSGARLLKLAAALVASYTLYTADDGEPERWDSDAWQRLGDDDFIEDHIVRSGRIDVLARLLQLAKAAIGLAAQGDLAQVVPRLQQLVAALQQLDPAQVPAKMLARVVALFEQGALPARLELQPRPGWGVAAGLLETGGRKELGIRLQYERLTPCASLQGSLALGLPTGNLTAPTLSVSASVQPPADVMRRLDLSPLGAGPQLLFTGELGSARKLGVRLLPTGDSRLGMDLLPWRPPDERWLASFAAPLLADFILAMDGVRRRLEAPFLRGIAPESHASIAKILLRADVLYLDGAGYHLRSLAELGEVRPDHLLSQAFATMLEGVHRIQLLRTPDGGTIDLVEEDGAYGVRVRMTDVVVGKPGLQLQFGKPLPGHTAADAPGAQVLLVALRRGKPAFEPSLKLQSVGVDYRGTGGKPLVTVAGCSLQGVQPRLSLRYDRSGAKLGAAARLEGFSIPLKLGGGSGSNPVAQDLLGSGSPGSDAPPPAFSAVLGYDDRFYGCIESPGGEPMVWLRVDRSIGPLHCRQLGLGLETGGPRLLVGYDGSVTVGPLGLDLVDLSVGVPLRTPTDLGAYSLALGGLNVSFEGGPVEISGGLLKTGSGAATEYTGLVFIKAQAFSIAGTGSYALVEGAPSFFAFAVLYKDLGGPAWAHVRGLAIGFGYNRRLLLPELEGVRDFPLVRAAREPAYLKAGDPKAALTALRNAVPASRGDYWLAAGVLFTSFEMVQSIALLSVSFGHEVEIAVLGFSTVTVPTGSTNPIAYAEIALKATLRPAQGLLAVSGQLTPASYVLSRDCRLSGQFAFYSWFAGEHEGDFVLTLGGYHPKFLRPPHYPVVSQRLGLNWQVSGNLVVKGQAYFALTPSFLMAGGMLQATWQAGDLKAWFDLEANFLLCWKPFYYEADARVSIGVSYRVNLWLTTVTLSVQLGVNVALWGPPFGGEARVDWTVISFTIRFGAARPSAIKRIDWTKADGSGFKESFLPAPTTICAAAVQSGLLADLRQDKAYAGLIDWVVSAEDLALETRSAIPGKGFAFNGSAVESAGITQAIGVGPMGLAAGFFGSVHNVQIQKHVAAKGKLADEGAFVDCDRTRLEITPLRKTAPRSLWDSAPVDPRKDLVSDDDKVIAETLRGIRVAALARKPGFELDVRMDKLRFSTGRIQEGWWDDPAPPRPVPWSGTEGAAAAIARSWQSDTASAIRKSFTDAGWVRAAATQPEAFDVEALVEDPVLCCLGAQESLRPRATP